MTNKKSSWFGSILFGAALFLGSFPVLFWNEGRSLHRFQTLAEGRDVVVENVSTEGISRENEARLVHMTGFADAHEELTDPKFRVSANDVLKLKRTVEMYQWKQTSSGDEDSPPSYSRVWSARPISSANFKNRNKRNPNMPYESATQYANRIQFGAFQLSRSLAESIDNWERIDVTQALAELPDTFKHKTVAHDQGFYVGSAPNQPQIGDLRIHFSVARPTDVSVIAQQAGQTFQKYAAKTVTGSIERLEVGSLSAGEMFTHMETENTILTWALRGTGAFMMFMGTMLILDPIMRLLNFVPLAGRLATSAITMVVMLSTVAMSVTTIAVAWMFCRPALSGILLAIAGASVFAASRLFKSKAQTVTHDNVMEATAVENNVVEDSRITVVG